MKKIALLLTVLTLSFTKVNAQITFVKTYTIPGSVSDGFSIVEDIAGGYLFTGISTDTITYISNTFLAKCDPLGMVNWLKNYDTSFFFPSMKRFVNGDLLIAGGQSIMKLDNLGNVIWSKRISGISFIAEEGFIITSDGGVAISTYLQVQADCSLQLIRLDSSGNVLWSKETPLSSNSIGSNKIIETFDGALLTAFDEYVTNLAQQIFVIKTDANGNLLWSKSFGFTSFDHVTDVMQSADGNYIIAGSVSGNSCIFKLDTAGTSIWAKTYGQSEISFRKILEATSGNLILAGAYRDSVNDALVLSMDSMGNILIARTYAGVFGANVNDIYPTVDMGYIAVCSDGVANPGNPTFYMQLLKLIKMDSLLYTACDLQTLNFVVSNQSLSLHIGTYLIPGNISSSPVVVNQYQTQMTPTLVCKVIGVDEMGIDDLIEIFPNPTTDKLTIEINSSYIQKISICNLTGKLIKTISCNNSNLEIDVSNLSPGIYFLNGTSDQGTFRKRFVKN